MQTLSLRDDRAYRQDSARSGNCHSGYRPPRLPTPEPSRSSMEPHESRSQVETMRPDSGRDVASRHSSNGQPHKIDAFRRSFSQQESRGQMPPHPPQSPPYEASDEQRPSLPPLKTVLGENLSSPPHTPRFCSAQLQPVPREPTYTTDTFKPPSLYPNKKQKTEALGPRPPFASASFAPSPSSIFESPGKPRMQPKIAFSSSDSKYNSSVARQQSIQRPDALNRARSPALTVQRSPLPRYDDKGPINTAFPHPTQRYEAPERLPLSASSEQAVLYATHGGRPRTADNQRVSSNPHNEYYPHAFEKQYNRSFTQSDRAYPSPSTDDYTRNNAVGRFGRVEHDPFQPASDLVHGSIQNPRPTDSFAPAPYEYCYTKARKRSNLPKHSTEIMRAWFDQNIGNPYPSEDQKALFANATGISLTQVSNWFINHRRRCPELRDKRVERRKL